jgi:hypothetical protein
MTKVQRNLKVIKRTNKRKKLLQLAPHYLKLLKDGRTRNGVENIRNVYLEHHPIGIGIQNGPNIMDHGLTTFSNHNPELIW